MRLAAVPGVTPVSLRSADATAAELLDSMVAARGRESAHDPGLRQAALDAAELAHASGAGLVAVVAAPDADPAVLVAVVVYADAPHGGSAVADLRRGLLAAGRADLQDVTEATTALGHPVLLVERVLPADATGVPGCQLQALVVEPGGRRTAVFTLHSATGRGWLSCAAVLGALVSTVDFEASRPGRAPAP